MCRLGAMKIASVLRLISSVSHCLLILYSYLNWVPKTSMQVTMQVTMQDNTTENQVVKDCDDDQLALSWHQVGTKSAPSFKKNTSECSFLDIRTYIYYGLPK